MSDIKLLDCTLRDGGYVNDWEFGHKKLISIYERLCDARVDMIELGFLDDRRPFDHNRSIFPDTKSIRSIWQSSKKKPSMVLAMIDYGTCDISHLEPASDSFVDTIRVIFKEHLMEEAMEFCAEVKSLGYNVCSQLVSVTSYTDDSLCKLIDRVNEVKPYAVSMVDTYGLLNPKRMSHIYEILDNKVDSDIRIGFHGHNNFQLAYANSIAFIEESGKHDILVDGTLYGMGKSAGNTPIELLAMYLNNESGKSYNVDPMLEAIEESIMDFYAERPWGYKVFYYLSAKNECHPSYVSDYQNTENLSITRLDNVLAEISPADKKLLYDREISRKNYREYIQNEADESESLDLLEDALGKRDVLIIGPGKNIKLQSDRVFEYIEKNSPTIISINYVPDEYAVDYVFATKRNRYQQMVDDLQKKGNEHTTIIATSNVECIQGQNTLFVNRAPLIEKEEAIKDNSLLMLLQVIKKIGIKRVALAGFDGYSPKEDNYFNASMEYTFVKNYATQLNRHIRNAIRSTFSDIEFTFVTYSHYEEDEDSHFEAF